MEEMASAQMQLGPHAHPHTPPLLMVMVPPSKSSIASFPSRAFCAASPRARSISAIDLTSQPRMTGVTKPLGPATATLMLTKSW
jgi:hypothetical protein